MKESSRRKKIQHQQLLNAELALSICSRAHASAMKSDIFVRKRLSVNPSISELKSVLKIRLMYLSFMRPWLQGIQCAKGLYQLEVESLNKALNIHQNHMTSIMATQNKKISGFPLVFCDHLPYAQTKLMGSPVNLSHKQALQPPFLFDKSSVGEILKERSVCQRSIHEKEFFAEQLQNSIQYTENEVQIIQKAIQQYGWIRRGCSALLDLLLWRS